MSLRGVLQYPQYSSEPPRPRPQAPIKRPDRLTGNRDGIPPIGIFLIVMAIVVAIIFILLVWLSLRSSDANEPECRVDQDCQTGYGCDAGKCVFIPTCTADPAAPTNVRIAYDSSAKTATLTWNAVTGATGYSIYRKLNDDTVGRNTFDETKLITSTTYTFNNLPEGVNWFVVSARNACGESVESVPPLSAASCALIPDTPTSLLVTSAEDDCINESITPPLLGNLEIATITYDDQGPEFSYLVYGDGWKYGDGKFFQLIGTNTAIGVFACETVANINVIAVRNASSPTITNQTEVQPGLWKVDFAPSAFADEFAWTSLVFLYEDENAVDPYGIRLLGGTFPGNQTSFSFSIPQHAVIDHVVVGGYMLCDKSKPASIQYETAATVP